MPQFLRWPSMARRSSRSSFDWGTADNWFGGSFAAKDMTSSARGKVRWRRISPGSTPNGHQGAATARSCDGSSLRGRASAVRLGSSPSGPPGVAPRKRLTPKASSASHRPFDDDRTSRPFESRDGHNRRDRERRAPLLAARAVIASFQAMVRNKVNAELTAWIARARWSLAASFASGVAKDEAAVRAAITLPWSNGQTEGQIAKLKLVKARCAAGRRLISSGLARAVRSDLHQICARAKLARRLTGAPQPSVR
jgi:hypothetical protein